MVKEFNEFAEEFRDLRSKMKSAKNITPNMAASWTSQLAGISERLANRIDLLDEELNVMKQKMRSGKDGAAPAKKDKAPSTKKDKSLWDFLGR